MREPRPLPTDVGVPDLTVLSGRCQHSGRVSARFAGSALRPVSMSCERCGTAWRTTDPVPQRVIMGVWVPPQLRPQSIPERDVIGACGFGQLLRVYLTEARIMPQLSDMAVVLAAWELASRPTQETHCAMDLLASWLDGGPETHYQLAQSLLLATQAGLVRPVARLETRQPRLGDIQPTDSGWAAVARLEPLPWVAGPR